MLFLKKYNLHQTHSPAEALHAFREADVVRVDVGGSV